MSSDFEVLKISRLPEYFREKELKAYLEQFGTVCSLKFPRSSKTLKGKGYAFVKMSKEVAPVVASTLHNVLNFNKIMKCEIISDPNWRSFKRISKHAKSTQVSEQARQTVSALKRVTLVKEQKVKQPQLNRRSKAERRRTKIMDKRIARIQNTNPEFKFQKAT